MDDGRLSRSPRGREAMMQRIRDEYGKPERNQSTQDAARDHAVHEGGMLDRDR